MIKRIPYSRARKEFEVIAEKDTVQLSGYLTLHLIGKKLIAIDL